MRELSGVRVGCAMTGSFCTFAATFAAWEALRGEGAELYPIMSANAWQLDTRFYKAEEARRWFMEITGREIWHEIPQVEPIGPKKLLDLLIVAPCTGNSLAKIAAGIADTAVTMAVKSHLRNGRPVLLAVSTNDGLAQAARNIGTLLATRHMFFVPVRQDDCEGKPKSLVADMGLFPEAAREALSGRQPQPVLREALARGQTTAG